MMMVVVMVTCDGDNVTVMVLNSDDGEDDGMIVE